MSGKSNFRRSSFSDSHVNLESWLLNPNDSWIRGPDLPRDQIDPCIVALNDEESEHLLVGGKISNLANQPSSQAWTIHSSTNVWQNAGELRTPVQSSACARGTVAEGTREVVIVAGYVHANDGMSLVDIFDVTARTWYYHTFCLNLNEISLSLVD